jgi:hypothetical protein
MLISHSASTFGNNHVKVREEVWMRDALARIGAVLGWLITIVLLSLWLVEAVHRGRASGIWIVAVSLAGVIGLPMLVARHRSEG